MAGKPKYGIRKDKLNLSVTPKTKERMKEIAEALNTSQSELLEKWVQAWDELQSIALLGESLTCFGK